MEWWLIFAFIGIGVVFSYPAGWMVLLFFAACAEVNKFLRRAVGFDSASTVDFRQAPGGDFLSNRVATTEEVIRQSDIDHGYFDDREVGGPWSWLRLHLVIWVIGAVPVFSIGIYGYFRNT